MLRHSLPLTILAVVAMVVLVLPVLASAAYHFTENRKAALFFIFVAAFFTTVWYKAVLVR